MFIKRQYIQFSLSGLIYFLDNYKYIYICSYLKNIYISYTRTRTRTRTRARTHTHTYTQKRTKS